MRHLHHTFRLLPILNVSISTSVFFSTSNSLKIELFFNNLSCPLSALFADALCLPQIGQPVPKKYLLLIFACQECPSLHFHHTLQLEPLVNILGDTPIFFLNPTLVLTLVDSRISYSLFQL